MGLLMAAETRASLSLYCITVSVKQSEYFDTDV